MASALISAALREERERGQWTLLSNDSPTGKRYGHSVVIYGNLLYIFGGCDETGAFSNKLITFDLDTQKWSFITDESKEGPCHRHFHTAVVYNHAMYIHGGKSNGYHNDLYAFDFKSSRWKLITRDSHEHNAPLARYGHSAVVIGDRMIVYGGYDRHGFICEDICEFDFTEMRWGSQKLRTSVVPPALATSAPLSTSEKPTTPPTRAAVALSNSTATSPLQNSSKTVKTARYHHSAVCYGASMYVFGGKDVDSALCSAELLEFQYDTRRWHVVAVAGGTPPPQRWGHRAVVIGDRMVVFGGAGAAGGTPLADLYTFHFGTRTWQPVEVATCPAPRAFMGLAARDKCVYVVGGKDAKTSMCFQDVHRFAPEEANTDVNSLNGRTPRVVSIGDEKTPKVSDSASPLAGRLRLKFHYGDEIRIISVDVATVDYDELASRLSKEYHTPLRIRYRDEEGDYVTVRSQEDLLEALRSYSQTGGAERFLKFYLAPQSAASATAMSTSTLPTSAAALSSLSGSSSHDHNVRNSFTNTANESSTPSTTTTAPRRVVRWKKGQLLGKGGFGSVFLGMNTDTGELMAVKEISVPVSMPMLGFAASGGGGVGVSSDGEPHSANSAGGAFAAADPSFQNSRELRALQKEIELLESLPPHPHVVRYLGAQLDTTAAGSPANATLYLFMEYVPGGSVTSLLAKFRRFTEPLVRSFARQILLGLQYLHSNRIVHRDIKGANVLVTDAGVVKLSDFGAARRLREIAASAASAGGLASTGAESTVGTPYWMAPEVITAKNRYGRRADIWSVGATVVEMATGRPPFAELSPVAAMFRIGTDGVVPTLPAGHGLSNEAVDFLSKCFERDPKRRPTAAELLLHPFVANVTANASSSNLLPNSTAAPLSVSSAGSTPLSFSRAVDDISPTALASATAPPMTFSSMSVTQATDSSYATRDQSSATGGAGNANSGPPTADEGAVLNYLRTNMPPMVMN